MILPGEKRNLTTYISGYPGLGKSSLIQQMALQDMRNGHGVCIIAPDRDLIDRLVHWVPRERAKDTIYFDSDLPIPIDMFSYQRDADRGVLQDQLVNLFHLDAAPISRPRVDQLIGTFLDANVAGGKYTLLDIIPFVKSADFREGIFKLVPHRREDWTNMPKEKEWESITGRLIPFKERKNLRAVFSGGGINLIDVLEKQQIFLVNLRDTDTDLFLGSLIVAKIQQAIFARDAIPDPNDRIPYYLYVDECDVIMEFCAKEFGTMLTRARKYKLCLTMANVLQADLPKEIQRKLPVIYTKFHFVGSFRAQLTQGIVDDDYEPPVISTPTYLGASPGSYAKWIMKNTQDTYAGNAPVDNAPSIPPPKLHTKRNDHEYDKPDPSGPDTTYKKDKPKG